MSVRPSSPKSAERSQRSTEVRGAGRDLGGFISGDGARLLGNYFSAKIMTETFHSTTILAVSWRGSVAFAGDGQVTLGSMVVKHHATKVRRLSEGKVLAGFAGSAADGFTLIERFEGKLSAHGNNLSRAAVELAKEWRSDRYLRRLEAMLIVCDRSALYLLSGSGDVIIPDDGVVAIGSGAPFALGAARALMLNGRSDLSAREIAETGLKIAAQCCPYTNSQITVEELADVSHTFANNR